MSNYPSTLPTRDAPLEDAFERIVEEFEAVGLKVQREEEEDPLLSGFVSGFVLVSTEAHPVESTCSKFIVATEPWTHELSMAFVTTNTPSLLAGQKLQLQGNAIKPTIFYFRSAYPISPVLEYIFDDWPAGRMEAESIALFNRLTPSVDLIAQIAEEGSLLLKKHFGVTIDLDDIASIGIINDLLLHSLRPCDDPSLALASGVYKPTGILTLLGSILGELICRAYPDKICWIEPSEKTGGSFPVLEVQADDSKTQDVCYTFPYDKLLQFYQNGQDRDLRTYYDVVIASTLAGKGLFISNKTLSDSQEHLLPVLKPAGWNTEQLASIELLPEGPIGTPIVTAAIDHEQQILFVVKEKLEEWSIDFSELMGKACANLARRSRDMEQQFESLDFEEAEVYRLNYSDYFNASRIMLAEKLFKSALVHFEECEVFAVAIPNRDHLLLTPARTEEELHFFRNLVLWFHERQPAPISSLCFLLGAGGLIGYYGTSPDA